MAETVGQRLYLIRLACGDGVRNAETLRDFSRRVKAATGKHYDPMALSLLERMKQTWRLEDINVLAVADPKERGPIWLAFGDQLDKVLLDPSKDRGLTEAEEERALKAAAALAAEQKRRKRGGSDDPDGA